MKFTPKKTPKAPKDEPEDEDTIQELHVTERGKRSRDDEIEPDFWEQEE